MVKDIFIPTDILVPANTPPEKWSVIACDQFSSQPEYWERVSSAAGNTPSTLNMIIPEAYLARTDWSAQIEKIRAAMEDCLDKEIFREVRNSFIYVERKLPDGRIRKGIVGALDLEEYDFSGRHAQIRASEGTILDRLPARVEIRKAAPLELPHIIALIDDRENAVIGPVTAKSDDLETVYDFCLMEGGGRLKGKAVSGDYAGGVTEAMRGLFRGIPGHGKGEFPALVIGDGNHSLASAKVYWDGLKQSLAEHERETHPARWALAEVCNVYDPAIDFKAIHRVLCGVDPHTFIRGFEEAMPQGSDYVLQWVSRDSSGEIGIKADCIGDMLVLVQGFIDGYIKSGPGQVAEYGGIGIDYIHGEDVLTELAQNRHCLGIILPAMDKSDLFKTVAVRGVFPRKSFSIGHAKDKRYYMECRKIRSA